MKALDWSFKVGLLIVGFALVAVYYESSQNGRYVYRESGNLISVMDTKTGTVHMYSAQGENKLVAHINLPKNKSAFTTMNSPEEPGK